MQTLLPFYLFLLLSAVAASAATCNPDDEVGLLGFKLGIKSDPSGMLTSWKKGTNCCQWFGVACRDDTRVTTLTLVGQPDNRTTSLSGTISSSLSKLHYLDGLYLQDLKNLSGPFPNFLLGLPNLQYIYIENSKLSGPLPTSIGKSTQFIVLSVQGNQFSGPIPSSIGNLTQLIQLRLGSNRFTGTIPSSIRFLRNVTLLGLARNQLSGPIPDFFSEFTNLLFLELSHNNFTGTIPRSIATLSRRLVNLELGHNALSGPIPNYLGLFQALDTLDLSSNKFSGPIPKSFTNLTKIFNLDLSRNQLTDPFPQLNVKGIESLDLSYNNFHLGSIPKWVTTSPIIYSLKLAKCGLKFKLDDWKPTETYFYDYIDLSDNEITGSPAQLLNRTEYLKGFYAAGNKLKFDFGKLRFAITLKELDLSRNLVVGGVSKAISGLSKLNVSYNHLCGTLPPNKFPASAFVGNDCLCGSPLPKCKA